MADKKVSELTAATSVGTADLLYYVQGGASKKLAVGTLFANAPTAKFTGNVSFKANNVSNAGAISSLDTVARLTVGAETLSCTLAAGAPEQFKIVVMSATQGGSVIISSLGGNANVTFSKVGHTATFLYTSNVWYVLGGTANINLP